ncbi:MAG: TNT domain-containing protein [Ancalomicrobiaceae bacterium]|nr:TNT domain-containing protein [Ancalomicrobiaceae bacterium]
MRVDDIVILRTTTEVVVITSARPGVKSPVPLASGNHVDMLLRLHALDATAMGALRDFWERYGGGGHRSSLPNADRLIALVAEGISTGRFTAYVLIQHPHISAIDPSGSRAQAMQKVLQLADERRKQGLHTLHEAAYGSEGKRGKALKPMGKRLDLADRLFDTFQRAIPFVPGSVKAEFRGLVESPERLGFMVGMLVAWAGLHAVVVGEVLDGVALAALIATSILEGTSIAMSFFAILDGARLFSSFLTKVATAKWEGDLDDAAKDLANAIAAIGVATLVNAVAHAASKLRTSDRKANRGGAGKGSVLTKEESEALNQRIAKARVGEDRPPPEPSRNTPPPPKKTPPPPDTGKASGTPPASPSASPAPQLPAPPAPQPPPPAPPPTGKQLGLAKDSRLRRDLGDDNFNDDGSLKWPAFPGSTGPETPVTLPVGTVVDRYGSPFGTFTSPAGIPYEQRALPYDQTAVPYSQYRVLKPLGTNSSTIAPAFGDPGGGTQYRFDKSVQDLINEGYLEKL